MRERLRDPAFIEQRRWFTLLVLCLSLVVIVLDNTILNVALPTLAKAKSDGGLGASASELQWIVDSYVIVFAGLLLTAGSLGDRFGRYKALAFGLAVFGIGSASSAVSASAARSSWRSSRGSSTTRARCSTCTSSRTRASARRALRSPSRSSRCSARCSS